MAVVFNHKATVDNRFMTAAQAFMLNSAAYAECRIGDEELEVAQHINWAQMLLINIAGSIEHGKVSKIGLARFHLAIQDISDEDIVANNWHDKFDLGLKRAQEMIKTEDQDPWTELIIESSLKVIGLRHGIRVDEDENIVMDYRHCI